MGPYYIFLCKISLLSNSLYYLLENENILMPHRVLVVVDEGSLASRVPTVVLFCFTQNGGRKGKLSVINTKQPATLNYGFTASFTTLLKNK